MTRVVYVVSFDTGSAVKVATGDYDTVIRNIEVNVSPASWDMVGGPGSITADRSLRLISVSHTWQVLEQVDAYLTEVRQAKLAAERNKVLDPVGDAAVGHVYEIQVAEHVVQGVGLGYMFALSANHIAQLGLGMMHYSLGDVGNLDGVAVADDAGSPFVEEVWG